MSQTIKVEAVTKEPRIWQGKTTWGVKLPGDGGWITLYKEQRPNKGDTLEVNITERNVKGRLYVDAFPVMPPLVQAIAQPGQQNGTEPVAVTPKKDERPTWDDYREVAKAIHNLALVFEPDIPAVEGRAETYIDRAPARVGFINKALEHYVYGKFIVPKEDDAYVPPDADDIPF